MKKNTLLAALATLGGAGLILLYSSVFVVQQTQQALVLQFGEWVRTVQEPGLNFKIPFIQDVVYYDKRVLELSPDPEEVILSDQKRIVVDTYLRYRIADPLVYYRAVNSEALARSRISDMVVSAMRRVMGTVDLSRVLSRDRVGLMEKMRAMVAQEASAIGISVTDLRIRRADLPLSTSQAVYDRIRSERAREVADFTAKGKQDAVRIRAEAEREATVTVARAQKTSQELRGEGDALAIAIYNEAFGVDPGFFDFYYTMQSYYQSIEAGTTSLVLSPDHPYLKYFGPAGATGAGRP
ncbi:protease modulator HflC [Phaeovibrio sulfidiphilus]|uniref:Protein HflC n=1 Tax=Phaeovibrio sulfidiphilus TaxID=1220600 RepID=A0A8J6YR31_9PROT|nr:protease modulator HflC [Phaeovibrio sulfidiphilus]MBE1237837.1 protease modulator HflC [Phaeovibrio sulfidiphilus]